MSFILHGQDGEDEMANKMQTCKTGQVLKGLVQDDEGGEAIDELQMQSDFNRD